MGTWGFGILDDDFASDVHDRYLQAVAAGQSPDAIVQLLIRDFGREVSDPDEGPIFWLAIAQAQWDTSSVSADVQQCVEQIVAEDRGLARWQEAGPHEAARRKAALARFVKKIRTPRKKIARAPVETAVPFTVGDCLAIDLGDGRFGAAVVTK